MKKDGLAELGPEYYIRRLRDIEGLADGVAADLWRDVGKVHRWRGAAITIRNKAAKLRKQIATIHFEEES